MITISEGLMGRGKESCPNHKTETVGDNTMHYCIFRYWGCYFDGDDYTQCQFYDQLKAD